MKSYKSIFLATLALVCLNSCLKESSTGNSGEGLLSITVNKDTPSGKAVSEVTDYPVLIKSAGATVKSFDKVSEIPASMRMDVGDYTIESHTSGNLTRKMYDPYYSGSTDIKILAGTTTNAEVICTMQNTKISVIYGEDFYNVFSSWTITIDDGTDTALTFTNNDARSNNQTVFYWLFTNQATEVNINFIGFTKNNDKISQKYTLAKSAIETHYDDDKEYFAGGDALEFTFTPEESTTGKISGVNLSAKIEFTETEENVIVNIEDVPTFDPGDDEPTEDDPDHPALVPITLTIPTPIEFSSANSESIDPSIGDVKIQAENGIQSVLVKVTSTSGEMIESLNAVAGEYDGVDLVGGCEVVNNTNLVAFLGQLGKTITVPAVGDTEYTFPVGQFFGFLSLLPGEHKFGMTVTDTDGNTKSGTIVVKITD